MIMVVIIFLFIDYFRRYKSFCVAMSPVYVPFDTIPINSVLQSKTEYKENFVDESMAIWILRY